MTPIEMGKHRPHLSTSQDHRQACWPLRPLQIIEPPKFSPEHLLIEEHQSAERLVLGGSRHLPLCRQMADKRRNLAVPQGFGVTVTVKQDKALDPLEIGLFGAATVVLDP